MKVDGWMIYDESGNPMLKTFWISREGVIEDEKNNWTYFESIGYTCRPVTIEITDKSKKI